MDGDLLADGLGEVVPDMPPVPDLQGVGQNLVHGVGVAGGAVPADDLHTRMLAQPRCKGVGPAVGQDIDTPAGLCLDQDGRVGPGAPQEKSSTPSTRGVATTGNGIRSRARSVV